MGILITFPKAFRRSDVTGTLPAEWLRKERLASPKGKAKAAANGRKRHAAKIDRVPPWADAKAIDALYAEAKRLEQVTGVPHHVDHYYPLQGRTVSGLHVEANLRVVPWHENQSKWAKMPDDAECQWP